MKNSKIRVLLLEDDLDLFELIRDYFSPRGYEFIHSVDGESGMKEVLSAIAQDSEFDLILTDFKLPKMNGVQFIESIQEVSPETPIILMTAHSSVDLAIDAIDKGAFDFVVKPIQFPQLNISMARAARIARLQKENKKLQDTSRAHLLGQGKIIAKSPTMRSILDVAKRVARSQATVLITGESGSGKEVLAQFIHQNSPRKAAPFVAINCSAIPENLLESELFGHTRGAFTGAEEKREGLFEEANGGTLFLDEIGDLSLTLQTKLLRVLQDRTIKRVGENQYRPIDVRVLTATHKDLAKAVIDKQFREDLFFRLNVIPIRIPALRERREDILPLAEHFLNMFRASNQSSVKGFSKDALKFLLTNDWKGNVRELVNTIERAVVLCEGDWIRPDHFLPALIGSSREENSESIPLDLLPEVDPAEVQSIAQESHEVPVTDGTDRFLDALMNDEVLPLSVVELRYIKHVLEKVHGVKDRAAKILKVDRKTLYRKIEQLHQLENIVN